MELAEARGAFIALPPEEGPEPAEPLFTGG